MAHVISFQTSLFDPRKERPNPVNPIAGESVLVWIRENVLAPPYESTDPDAEDWGWYIDVPIPGSSYLVGACALVEEDSEPQGDIEWLVQVEKKRSLLEKLLGRNKMAVDDPLVTKLVSALKGAGTFTNVQVETNA